MNMTLDEVIEKLQKIRERTPGWTPVRILDTNTRVFDIEEIQVEPSDRIIHEILLYQKGWSTPLKRLVKKSKDPHWLVDV